MSSIERGLGDSLGSSVVALDPIAGGDINDAFRARLADGWRDRIALHQLYPLAAHACLFGGGYGGQVVRTLADLTG